MQLYRDHMDLGLLEDRRERKTLALRGFSSQTPTPTVTDRSVWLFRVYRSSVLVDLRARGRGAAAKEERGQTKDLEPRLGKRKGKEIASKTANWGIEF